MSLCKYYILFLDAFQGVLAAKIPSANAGDIRNAGSILGSGTSPGEGNGNPFQYSCLGNPMDREAWKATVYWVAKESRHNLASQQQTTMGLYHTVH